MASNYSRAMGKRSAGLFGRAPFHLALIYHIDTSAKITLLPAIHHQAAKQPPATTHATTTTTSLSFPRSHLMASLDAKQCEEWEYLPTSQTDLQLLPRAWFQNLDAPTVNTHRSEANTARLAPQNMRTYLKLKALIQEELIGKLPAARAE